MTKEYTAIRRFYAVVGFITLLAIGAIILVALFSPDTVINFAVKVLTK